MIVVGGHGRGGTRVPMRILRLAGLNGDASHTIDGNNDTRALMEFAHIFFESKKQQVRIGPDLEEAWAMTLADLHGQDVVKDVRMVYFLPYIHRLTLDLKFLHVVRDGRDIAQNQCDGRSARVAMMKEWQTGQLAAANYAADHMSSADYLRVRLEDIIADRYFWTRRILRFAGADCVDLVEVARFITPRETVGSGKKSEDADVMTEAGREALTRFEYL